MRVSMGMSVIGETRNLREVELAGGGNCLADIIDVNGSKRSIIVVIRMV